MHALICLLAAGAALQVQSAALDSTPPPLRPGPVLPAAFPSFGTSPQLREPARFPQRPMAVEFSDGYYVRLKIHRYASYAMLPLFVGQYAIGKSLYNDPPTSESDPRRTWHGVLATGIYGLFAVNTVTGVWNLWEGRAVKQGRTRRYVHTGLMLIAEAGFVATSMLAPDDEGGEGGGGGGGGGGNSSQRTTHRNMAIASFSTALVGGLMMYIWNDK
jgi:hypothetical protein